MRITLASLGGLLLATPLVLAGPLDPAVVDSQARWVIHVDVESALRTAVGRSLLSDHRSPAAAALESLRWRLGVSAVNDVHGVTVYGRSECADPGTVVVDMTAAADALHTSLAAAGLPGYQRTDPARDAIPGTVAVHSWKAEGQRVFAAIVPGSDAEPDVRRVVVAPSIERLEQAMGVIAGSRQSAQDAADAEGQPAELSLEPDENAIIFVSATELGSFEPRASVSRKISSLTINIGERAAGVLPLRADAANPKRTTPAAATSAASPGSLMVATSAGGMNTVDSVDIVGPSSGDARLIPAAAASPEATVDGPWFYATARLTTQDESAASQAAMLMRGVLGVMMHAAESEPEASQLRTGLSRVRIEALGKNVRVTLSEPVAQITTLIRESRQWLPEGGGGGGGGGGDGGRDGEVAQRATPGTPSPNTIRGGGTGRDKLDRAQDRAEHKP
jgi:hypothetical protein